MPGAADRPAPITGSGAGLDPSARERLRLALIGSALKLGQGVDSAGSGMSWLLDCREALLHARLLPLVGDLLWRLARTYRPDAVGGMTTSADPLTVAMLYQAAGEGSDVRGFSVRKAPKAYGLRKLIEGPPLAAGHRVVLVDDVVSSGQALERAHRAVTASGARVVAAVALVDFERPEAVRRRERLGLPVASVLTLTDLGLQVPDATGELALRRIWTRPQVNVRRGRLTQPDLAADPARSAMVVGADTGALRSLTWAGLERWHRPAGRGIGPLRSGPVVTGGTVLVGDLDGRLHGLSADGGDLRWSARLPGPVLRTTAAAAGNTQVMVAGERAGGGWLAAVDSHGEIAWRVDHPSSPTARPALDPERGLVVAGTGDGHLLALDAATGATRWSARAGGEVRGFPLIVAGLVVAGDYGGHISAWDAETGRLRWRNRVADWVYACPAAVGRFLLIGAERRMVALDCATGRVCWIAPLQGRVLGGLAVLAPGAVRECPPLSKIAGESRVVVATEGGDLAVVEATRGRVLAVAAVGSAVRASPITSGNRVAVPAADGSLVAFSIEPAEAGDKQG